jgi:hypothetical protein
MEHTVTATVKITEYGRRLFMVKKKLLSVTLVAVTVCSMIFTGCGNSAENTGNDTGKTDTDVQAGNTAGDVADVADDVEKPEKITIMVDGTFQATLADGQEEWVNKWEELTGIELEVIQPDHNAYYDVLGQTFASGPENWPDVVILGSSYYSGYAGEGALWDMTDAWNNSELKKNPNTDVSVVEGNMLDGHLYGLALGGGGGCMTFLRKQWLDNCGLDIPTTYEEYLEMLDAFSNGDPDGDGINGNTIGVSAAGFVGNEAPYTNYLPEFYQEIVADELNVKNVKFTDDVRDFTSYSFKPQLKTVGPKYGKMLGGIKAALDQLDGNAAMDEINETGSLKLDINGQEVTLFKEDLLIDTAQIEGYVSENDNGITVVLDTNLTEELLEEGFVREIISKIQTMRKEAGFEVMDKIKVTYKGSEKAEAVFAANGTQICSEVLAVSAEKAEPAGFVKEWKINGEAVFMGVEKEGR